MITPALERVSLLEVMRISQMIRHRITPALGMISQQISRMIRKRIIRITLQGVTAPALLQQIAILRITVPTLITTVQITTLLLIITVARVITTVPQIAMIPQIRALTQRISILRITVSTIAIIRPITGAIPTIPQRAVRLALRA